MWLHHMHAKLLQTRVAVATRSVTADLGGSQGYSQTDQSIDQHQEQGVLELLLTKVGAHQTLLQIIASSV